MTITLDKLSLIFSILAGLSALLLAADTVFKITLINTTILLPILIACSVIIIILGIIKTMKSEDKNG